MKGGIAISNRCLRRIKWSSLACIGVLGVLHAAPGCGVLYVSSPSIYLYFDGLELGIHQGSERWGCGRRQYPPDRPFQRIPAYLVSLGTVFGLSCLFKGADRLLNARIARRREAGECEECGYSLTGDASGVCSECGERR